MREECRVLYCSVRRVLSEPYAEEGVCSQREVEGGVKEKEVEGGVKEKEV